MTTLFKKSLVLSCAALVAFSAVPAKANDLINNQAAGWVAGDITQHALGDSTNLLRVGSISSATTPVAGGYYPYYPGGGAMNNRAVGDIAGDVFQDATNNSKNIARVGTLQGQALFNNDVSGTVRGDLTQMAHRDSFNGFEVGTVIAGTGNAESNFADGHVDGDVTQIAIDNSSNSALIGSVR